MDETVESPPPPERKSHDIQCLSCGAYNLPENIVCGACGASLPVVFDRDGRVFRWESDSPYWAEHVKRLEKGPDAPMGATLGLRILAVLALFILMVAVARRLEFPAPLIFIGTLLALVVTVRVLLRPNR